MVDRVPHGHHFLLVSVLPLRWRASLMEPNVEDAKIGQQGVAIEMNCRQRLLWMLLTCENTHSKQNIQVCNGSPQYRLASVHVLGVSIRICFVNSLFLEVFKQLDTEYVVCELPSQRHSSSAMNGRNVRARRWWS